MCLKFGLKMFYWKREIVLCEGLKNCELFYISMVLRYGIWFFSKKDVGKIDKMFKVVYEVFNFSMFE